jgi:hypothetical protein
MRRYGEKNLSVEDLRETALERQVDPLNEIQCALLGKRFAICYGAGLAIESGI